MVMCLMALSGTGTGLSDMTPDMPDWVMRTDACRLPDEMMTRAVRSFSFSFGSAVAVMVLWLASPDEGSIVSHAVPSSDSASEIFADYA